MMMVGEPVNSIKYEHEIRSHKRGKHTVGRGMLEYATMVVAGGEGEVEVCRSYKAHSFDDASAM